MGYIPYRPSVLVGAALLALVVGCRPPTPPTPSGPDTRFTATVCTAGVITLPCYTTGAFTLQADPITYVDLAVAAAKAFLKPVVPNLGPCTAAGLVDTTSGAVVASADVLCPAPAPGQPDVRQRVSITLHPVAAGGS